MRLGIMQPYFMPYIGYFQLMKYVDIYVIYDDVNYIKGGWINRNNFLIGKEKKIFTINLVGASPNKNINEIEIGDDFRKFKKMLELNYSKAPFYKEVINLIGKIITYPSKNLARFIGNSFFVINEYLNIDTELLYSSELKKNNSLKGSDKVLDICSTLNVETYINAIGGKELYDKQNFKKNKVNLSFLKPNLEPYNQQIEIFIPGLSFIDVLMFNSKEKVHYLLNAYVLE